MSILQKTIIKLTMTYKDIFLKLTFENVQQAAHSCHESF